MRSMLIGTVTVRGVPAHALPDPEPCPEDLAIIATLQERDGLETIVVLNAASRLRLWNIAWGYDSGDEWAHVTTNVSPNVAEADVEFFFTSDVKQILAPDATELYPR